ncbi:MAG: cytochrome c oxidase assembly protein [Yaniella sp.]|uniref:cytochrome c oxidase assembly protein n=1 Tax=Yaniella sp. TaxID=2773929 RepID=UPI00265075E8|nr:cytochrome c oxidase assembly protein [Yaniella sp.]
MTTKTDTPTKTAPSWLWPVSVVTGVAFLLVIGVQSGVTGVQELSDPGALTRWALPATKVIHNIAWSLTFGALMFAAVILPRWTKMPRRGQAPPSDTEEHPAYTRTVKIASVSAIIWTFSAIAQIVFTYSDVAGMAVNASEGFSEGMLDYVLAIAVGRAWFWMTIIAAVVTSVIFALRTPIGMAWAAVLSLGGVVPLALVGHSSSGDDHFAAVNSIGLHLLGVLLWLGGLVLLAMLAPKLMGTSQLKSRARANNTQPLVYTVLTRYSAVAGVAIALVAASGVANAAIRMEHFGHFFAPYGQMVVLKAVLTIALGLIGLAHRVRVIPRLKTGTTQPPARARKTLWQLIAVEVVIMVGVMVTATLLGSSEPPKPEEIPPDASPARITTKYELPPELSAIRWITEWRFNWLWVAVAIFLAIWYVRAIRKLSARGDKWPVQRTIFFFIGLAILVWDTSAAPAIYGLVLFSAHMVNHMILTMLIPIFLVLGAPITLAMRSMESRKDGTRGPREYMLTLLQSKYSKVITNPIFAAVNFAGSLVIFYFTPVFEFALRYHIGHEMMNIHFLLTGFIFVSVMIGIDPLPNRPSYPLRLVILLATMVFHAFIAVSLTGSDSLLMSEWFSAIGRDWGASAIEDQQIGGLIMWGTGEFPTVGMAMIVLFRWRQDDMQHAKRRDDRVDRLGDSDLDDLNEYYARMAVANEETNHDPNR